MYLVMVFLLGTPRIVLVEMLFSTLVPFTEKQGYSVNFKLFSFLSLNCLQTFSRWNITGLVIKSMSQNLFWLCSRATYNFHELSLKDFIFLSLGAFSHSDLFRQC